MVSSDAPHSEMMSIELDNFPRSASMISAPDSFGSIVLRRLCLVLVVP